MPVEVNAFVVHVQLAIILVNGIRIDDDGIRRDFDGMGRFAFVLIALFILDGNRPGVEK